MNGLERIVAAISLLMARVGGSLLLAAALLVAVEVVLRKSGLAVISLGTELSGYALAVSATWSFAYVVFERAHVRIDVLSQRLPEGPRAFVNVLALASLAAVGVVFSTTSFDTFRTSLQLGAHANTTLATPLALPQSLWTFGLAWFTLIAFYRTIVSAAALVRRDLVTVSRIAGPASLAAEVDEAVAETRSGLEPRRRSE